jgi:hypothetical protein
VNTLKGQNISNQWPNTKVQTPKKKRTKKCQNKQKEKIIKIRVEINEIETKKPYKESIKQKAGSLKE